MSSSITSGPAIASPSHEPAIDPNAHSPANGPGQTDRSGNANIDNGQQNVHAAAVPAPAFGNAQVSLGSVVIRESGKVQLAQTGSTLGNFFGNLASKMLSGLRSAWNAIAGGSRAVDSDHRARVSIKNEATIKHLETVMPGSLAANSAVIDAMHANAQLQHNGKSPLTREEITAYVAAGEKLIAALHADPKGKAGLVRLAVSGHPVAFQSSHYTTRALAHTIAAYVTDKDVASGNANAMTRFNAGEAVVFRDPGNRLGKFLASAPSAVKRAPSYFSQKQAILSPYRHEPKFSPSGERLAPTSEVAGSIDDARRLMPNAAGALVFDRVSGETVFTPKNGRKEDTEALCIRFTRSEHMVFEETNHEGVSERGSTLSNIAQGLDRLLMPASSVGGNNSAGHVIGAATVASKALRTDIAEPFRKLMVEAGAAGAFVDQAYRDRIEQHAAAVIDHGFETISETLFDLIRILTDQHGWPLRDALLEEAHRLEGKISERKTHFGDSPAYGLRRHGAEIHISVTEER